MTSGPDKKPLPNTMVSFHTEHEYWWFEGKVKRSGRGGRRWFATTDAEGRILTNAAFGKLNISVYTPLWQTQETYDVSSGMPTKIALHREAESKRKIRGRLLLAGGLEANLDSATIVIGALGGTSKDHQLLKTDAKGTFVVETSASPVGVFACTTDGRAFGHIEITDQPQVTLTLCPTLEISGKLIDATGKPLVGVKVEARAQMEGQPSNINQFVGSSFEALRLETVTDQQGSYSCVGLPSTMRINLFAQSSPAESRMESLGRFWLEEGESRPTLVSRLGAAASSDGTLAARFEKNLRDSKLLGYPLMVILSDKSERVAAKR